MISKNLKHFDKFSKKFYEVNTLKNSFFNFYFKCSKKLSTIIDKNTNLVSYDIIDSSKIGLITIKNSAKRNALNFNIISNLTDTFIKIDSDFKSNKFPRVIILNTEGEVFSSGHDLKELNSFDDNKRKQTFTNFSNLMVLLQKINPIIIAEVQGLATAAGCQLVATCDLVVASSNAKFETPGVKVGLFCSTPSVAIGRTIGSKRAMQMLLTGEHIDCKKAYEWGLVNEIVEIENLNSEQAKNKLRENSLKLAEKINKFSYETLSFGKKVFYEQSQKDNIADAYKIACEGMCTNLNFKDTQEGVKAFLEKRKPNFNV